jgi:hypothetical protein
VTARSIAAALAEIAGAYLVWVGIKEHKGIVFVALGAIALTANGVVAAFLPSNEFGRVLAAYGGEDPAEVRVWLQRRGKSVREQRHASQHRKPPRASSNSKMTDSAPSRSRSRVPRPASPAAPSALPAASADGKIP